MIWIIEVGNLQTAYSPYRNKIMINSTKIYSTLIGCLSLAGGIAIAYDVPTAVAATERANNCSSLNDSNCQQLTAARSDRHQRVNIQIDRTIALNPENALTYLNQGQNKEKSGDREGAILEYSKAIQLEPEYADAYSKRGKAKGILGDDIGAIEDFDRATMLDPKDVDAYYYRGLAKDRLARHQAAIADFTRAIALNPQNFAAYNSRGDAKINLKDLQGAKNDYSKAIAINLTYAEAYSNRGLAEYRLGDKQNANTDLKKASELYRQQQRLDSAYQIEDLMKKLKLATTKTSPSTLF